MLDAMMALGLGLVLLVGPLMLVRWALTVLRDFIEGLGRRDTDDVDGD